MQTSSFEDNFKRMLESTKQRKERDTPVIPCHLSQVASQRLGILAERVDKPTNELAEHFLEQAIDMAWTVAESSDTATRFTGSTLPSMNLSGASYEQQYGDARGKTVTGHDSAKLSRMECFDAAFRHLGVSIGIARETVAVATSVDRATCICGLTSKNHNRDRSGYTEPKFWFTVHQSQLDDLGNAKTSYVAFGCGTPDLVFLIPLHVIVKWRAELPPYTKGEGWHVQIINSAGRWGVRREGRGVAPFDVTEFLI